MFRYLKDRLLRALRWSEKYTKTDMVYIASGSFWSVVGQSAAALTSLALAMIVARYLPKDVYGDYKYVLAAVSLLGVFSLNGLGGSVFRSVALGFDGALKEAFWRNVKWSLLFFLSALGLAVYYFHADNYGLGAGILIGGCVSPFLASANLAQSFLTAKKDFRRTALYFDVIGNVVPVLSLIAAIFFLKTALALVIVYFISNVLVDLYFYVRVYTIYKLDDAREDPTMHSYGKHLSVMGIFTTLAGNLDQILVFHFVGPVQLAIYNYAIAVPDQIKGPLKYLDSMTQARFAVRSDSEIRSGMANKLVLLGMFYTAATVVYFLVAPFIFTILFPNYADAIFYSRIYALSLLIFPLDIASSYLTVKRKIWEQYVSNIGSSIFKIVAMAVGVVWWGVFGLIIALILSRIASIGSSYILYEFSSRSPEE